MPEGLYALVRVGVQVKRSEKNEVMSRSSSICKDLKDLKYRVTPFRFFILLIFELLGAKIQEGITSWPYLSDLKKIRSCQCNGYYWPFPGPQALSRRTIVHV